MAEVINFNGIAGLVMEVEPLRFQVRLQNELAAIFKAFTPMATLAFQTKKSPTNLRVSSAGRPLIDINGALR